jgi:hypothetical protein
MIFFDEWRSAAKPVKNKTPGGAYANKKGIGITERRPAEHELNGFNLSPAKGDNTQCNVEESQSHRD